MDDHGIDRAVVTAGGVIDLVTLSRQVVEGGHVESDARNDLVLASCQNSDGRLIPFYFGNPHRAAERYRSCAGDFVGLEISPGIHGVPLTDERTLALVSVAAEFGHPVYLVCIGRPGCGVHDLVRLAQLFPDVTFVLGHCGFVGIDVHAVSVISAQPNILAETSGCYTGVVRQALELLGADRMLFGTEYPLQHPAVELAKFGALRLDPQVWQKVAWGNGNRLLARFAG